MNEVRGWKSAAEIIVANFGSKVCYANARAQSVSFPPGERRFHAICLCTQTHERGKRINHRREELTVCERRRLSLSLSLALSFDIASRFLFGLDELMIFRQRVEAMVLTQLFMGRAGTSRRLLQSEIIIEQVNSLGG
jgi:hypothetical protein